MVFYLLILILIFFLILLILPIKIEIKFMYSNDSVEFKISTTYLFGLFKPEIDPLDTKKKSNTTGSKFLKIRNRKLIYYVWKKLAFKKLIWKTKIGLTDAALVSIAYGMLWSFKSIILNSVLQKKEIENIKINIFPIFNEDKFDIEFYCIFEIKMVHIIVIWLWLLKTMYRGGDNVDRASNRRFNENYNE